jgi:hypothetical protein
MKFFCCTKQELVRGEKKWIAYEYKNISKNLLLFTVIVPPLSVPLRYMYPLAWSLEALSGLPEQGSSISSYGNIQ